MSDLEDFDYNDSGDSDGEDLTDRSLEVTKSPATDDLVSLLECPVCFDLPLPPIRTCNRGHIICADCCPKLRICPLCQHHIGYGRNFFAEDFLNKSTMKCKFHQDGCLVELPGFRIRDHMQLCNYRPIKCQECRNKISYGDIDDHLLKRHGISKWDLNEEGSRIVLCQKLRTRNPYADMVIDTMPWRYSSITLLLGLIIMILADSYHFDESCDEKGFLSLIFE